MAEYKGVLVHCEVAEGKLAAIATELLGYGRKLADDLGLAIVQFCPHLWVDRRWQFGQFSNPDPKLRREAIDLAKRTTDIAAYMEAEKVRGEGDAEAMRIYGDAYNTDPGFYEFVRTLESYRKFLDDKTTIVLSSDSDLLKLLDKKGN